MKKTNTNYWLDYSYLDRIAFSTGGQARKSNPIYGIFDQIDVCDSQQLLITDI